MRSINVSTAVYAAIWAARREGEDDEDAILHRILGSRADIPAQSTAPAPGTQGFSEPKHKLDLPEGFEIFRKFKGTLHHAHASRGGWKLAGQDALFSSLSELSTAVGAAAENAWRGWSCRRPDGSVVTIGELRDPSTVQSRKR